MILCYRSSYNTFFSTNNEETALKKYDLLVIGSGPGGQKAAVQAAKLGKKVSIIDKNKLIGGVSLHTGTIPSKTLREAVLYLSGWREREFYGRSYRVKKDITAADLINRLDATIQNQVEVLEHQLLRNHVEIIQGTAAFQDPHTIQVQLDSNQTQTLHAEKIVIATGTTPVHPKEIVFDNQKIIDSDSLLKLEKLPRSIAIVGAGIIGAEYASILNALDIHVTLIDSREEMLDFLDHEIVDEFIHNLRNRNMKIRLGETVVNVTNEQSDRVQVTLKSGKQITADMILFTAGRQGCTAEMQLQNAGIDTNERGRLSVNENYQTTTEHIYAVGDVIGFPSLASTSMEQGRYAACHAFGKSVKNKLVFFPLGIYAVPEMSMVGINEQEAKRDGIQYETGIARFRETARGQIMGINAGMLKMLFSLEDKKLLGVHIVGEGATELIHIGQAVMKLKGTLDYFLETAFNYPTLAETYKIAALDAYNRFPKPTEN